MIYDKWDMILIALFMFGMGIVFGYAWGDFDAMRTNKGENNNG